VSQRASAGEGVIDLDRIYRPLDLYARSWKL